MDVAAFRSLSAMTFGVTFDFFFLQGQRIVLHVPVHLHAVIVRKFVNS